ncbi:hypothetical protein SAMN04488134_103163 [Amphibacillus marinus]|uniref:Uncharacterized protein n=1 Tax=Amphibacillus marinus TaxID=872970 RepID=A0A1H8LCP0_9BACI|nr:AimR family lysis-lysogeny pheromone receptor [Amphibacillus marinus]SEO02950.1 hypothetical protein SAMN04488134_103163 [Amphibacillus marinus]
MKRKIDQVSYNLNSYYHLDAEVFSNWLLKNLPQQQHEMALKDYFKHTTHNYSMCVGLEFFYASSNLPELEALIEKNKKTILKLNNDWALVYELMLAKYQQIHPPKQILQQLVTIKTNDLALKCLITFMTFAAQSALSNHDWLFTQVDSFEHAVNKVEHSILKPFIHQRLDNILFFFYWKRNDLILARKYGYQALAEATNYLTLANLHNSLSLTYIFEDFNIAKFHLDEAYKIAQKQVILPVIDLIDQKNRPFIYAHFNQPKGIMTTDLSERAHLAIARGRYQYAEELLAKLPKLTPFSKYYLGKATQDYRLLIKSYNDFVELHSDHFFARLPLNEINVLSRNP